MTLNSTRRRRDFRPPPFAAVAALLLAACAPVGPEGPHLLYSRDAASLDNPFPDARLLDPSGVGLQVRAGWYRPFLPPKALTGRMRALLEAHAQRGTSELFGVGNFAPTLLKASEPLDPDSLAGHFSRLVVSGGQAAVLERSLVAEHSTQTLKAPGLAAPADFPDFVLVRNSRPLLEGEEGVLVVTRGVRTLDGRELVRGAEFDASRPDLEPLAAALGVAEADILLVLAQKPAPVSATLEALADWVETPAGLAAISIPAKGTVAAGSVQRPVGRWTAQDSDWAIFLPFLEKYAFGRPAANVARVVVGELQTRDLRVDGVWNKDWLANPAAAPTVAMPFVLTVPTGTKPPGGWPTVIGAHGLGGRNLPVPGDLDGYCLENAQILAAEGLACLGIDATSHGLRGSSFAFLNVVNLAELRDNFRQMTFDLLQLERAAPGIDVDGDGQGDLDPDLGYLGNSLGAIMGAHHLTFARHVSRFVLNVPGGGLSNILVSEDIRDRLGLLIVAETGITFDSPEYYGAFPLFRAEAQAFLEPGDNINFSHRLGPDAALLVQEGVNDLTIPNFTTEDLARALALPVPTSTSSGAGPQRGLTRWDAARFLPAAQAAVFNGHNVFGNFQPVRDQAVRFLKTRGRELLVE